MNNEEAIKELKQYGFTVIKNKFVKMRGLNE